MTTRKQWVRAVNRKRTTAGLDEWIEERNAPVMMPRRKFRLLWFGLFWVGVFLGWVVGFVSAVLS